MIETILYIILVVLGFSFIIAIHEAGHFLAAKRAGIECPVFSVGFPLPGFLRLPERFRNIVSFHWRGTDYRIGWIPFGGFVQMKGQEDSPKELGDNDGAGDDFRNVSYGNKVLVILGGVIMNAITGIIFFILAFSVFGVTFISPTVGAVVPTDAKEGKVTELWKSGKVKAGDQIIAVDGKKVEDYEDAAYAAFFDDDGVIEMTFRRPSTGEEFTLTVPLHAIHKHIDADLPPIMIPPQVLVGFDEAERSQGKLERSDEVVAINGIRVDSRSDLEAATQSVAKGQPAKVTIIRDGQEMVVEYAPRATPFVNADTAFGASFVSPLKIKGVQDGSAAALGGMQVGDEIVAIFMGSAAEGSAILDEGWLRSVSQPALRMALDNAGVKGETLRLMVKRDKKEIELSLTPQLAGNAPNRFAAGVLFDESLQESLTKAKELTVASVVEGSIAYVAGLRAGDVITDIPSQPSVSSKGGFLGIGQEAVDIALYERIAAANNEASLALLGGDALPKTKLKIKRAGKEETLELAPTLDTDHTRALFVFGPRNRRTEAITYPFSEAFGVGIYQTNKNMMKILRTLKGLFTGQVSPTQLAGPVMIAKASYDLSQYGLGTLLFFLGFISINLAVVNVLPIPVLDGGLLLITTIEKIKGSPLNEKVLGAVQFASFLLVIGLMLFVVFNDIRNLIIL
ncbi:MAG: site-2 protease family protein [Planctomycetes bacterium]|nr:site-2 protease family protein [Planctomycetota bacterium]